MTILDLPGQAPTSPSTSQNVAPSGATYGDAIGPESAKPAVHLIGVGDAIAGPNQGSTPNYVFGVVGDNSTSGESATIPSTVGS